MKLLTFIFCISILFVSSIKAEERENRCCTELVRYGVVVDGIDAIFHKPTCRELHKVDIHSILLVGDKAEFIKYNNKVGIVDCRVCYNIDVSCPLDNGVCRAFCCEYYPWVADMSMMPSVLHEKNCDEITLVSDCALFFICGHCETIGTLKRSKKIEFCGTCMKEYRICKYTPNDYFLAMRQFALKEMN